MYVGINFMQLLNAKQTHHRPQLYKINAIQGNFTHFHLQIWKMDCANQGSNISNNVNDVFHLASRNVCLPNIICKYLLFVRVYDVKDIELDVIRQNSVMLKCITLYNCQYLVTNCYKKYMCQIRTFHSTRIVQDNDQFNPNFSAQTNPHFRPAFVTIVLLNFKFHSYVS